MVEISDTKLEWLIDNFLTKMPGGLSARTICYYINWAGLLTDDEWCLMASVNRFLGKNNNKYEKHYGTSVNGNTITYWTLKDEYKLVIPEVLFNEIIFPILKLLKSGLFDGFSNTKNAEVIDGYIDKNVGQLNSAEINKLYSYLYPASLDLMDEEKKIKVAKKLVTIIWNQFLNRKDEIAEDYSNWAQKYCSNVAKIKSLSEAEATCSDIDPATYFNSRRYAKNCSHMFEYGSSLTLLDLQKLDTYPCVSMKAMFSDCCNLRELDVSHFVTKKCTSMQSMFYKCASLTKIDLKNFDTSQVTDMVNMFFGCNELTFLDLSKFKTAKVSKMDAMFSNCLALRELHIENFDTSHVESSDSMFYNCNQLTNIYGVLDLTQNMNYWQMFANCPNLIEVTVKLPEDVTEEEFREDTGLSSFTQLHVLNKPKIESPKAKIPSNAKSLTVNYIENPDGNISINIDSWKNGTKVLQVLTAGIITLLDLEPLQIKELEECIGNLYANNNNTGCESTTNARNQPSLSEIKAINNKRNRRNPWMNLR